jgi:hypothetical protein
MPCRVTEFQKQQWRLQEERRAAEQREQQRQADLKNQWAQITTARAEAVLAGFQRANYGAKAQTLFALDALINKI